MSENKQEDLGMSKVEMIEARTDKDGSPPNELQQELHGTAEEKTTVKAWLSIFVSHTRLGFTGVLVH